jgi:preprotein translocase subunit SecD
MFQKFRSLPLLFFYSLLLFSITKCKPRGTGTWIFKLEARTENLSDADEKLIETIYGKRFQSYGIDEKDISIKHDGKIITVEISEASNYEKDHIGRIRKLLCSSARLSFWETYSAAEIGPKLNECFTADSLREHKLGEFISQSSNDGASPCIFYVKAKDTAAVNLILGDWKGKLPGDLRFFWTAQPNSSPQNAFGLITLKTNSFGKPGIEKPVTTDVHVEYDKMSGSGSPQINFIMDPPTASMFSALTKANIGKSIAIVIDGYVYSFPVVQDAITGGQCMISGNFTKEEADELTYLLKIEPMPCPITIIEEKIIP